MKRFIYSLMALASLATIACDDDLEHYTVTGLEESTLSLTYDNLVLSASTSDQNALIMTWTESDITLLGNSDLGSIVPEGIDNYVVEFSASSEFTNVQEYVPTSQPVILTGRQLNTLASNAGLKVGEKSNLYIRVRAQLGTNGKITYSETQTIVVTTYEVDYSYAVVLNNKSEATSTRLYSPNSDGIYIGFTAVSAWENWYLQENDGTVWGNVAVDGSAFKLATKDDGIWNFWYPINGGSYFVTVNTKDKYWNAVNIPSLSIVSGSDSTKMTFIKDENRWMTTKTLEAGDYTFTFGSNSALYFDNATGDGTGSGTTVSFGSSDKEGAVTYNSTEAITYNVKTAGEYTISLYLSDYNNLNYAITAGAEEVIATAPDSLYIIGLNDIWKFYFPLTKDGIDDWLFHGAFGVTSCPWGYYFGTEYENWGDTYKATTEDGVLAELGVSNDNITFTETGVFVWDVDTKNLTYTTTPVTSVAYTGFNDSWDLVGMTQAEDNSSIFYAELTLATASQWGGQIILNDNWDYKLGGSNGKLLDFGCKTSNITDDKTLEAGTYTLIVNFNTCTYEFSTEGYTAGGNGNQEETSSADEAILAISPTSVAYTGFDGNWDLHNMMQNVVNSKLWFATIDVASGSEYGPQLIVDGSWDNKVGGASGYLSSTTTNFTDDGMKGEYNGKYTLVANFEDGSYSFSETTIDANVTGTTVTELYYSGFDDWDLHALTKQDDGTWTATVSVTNGSEYGPQIILDTNWGVKWGGQYGTLSSSTGNIQELKGTYAGTYTLTVDVVNGTYNFVLNE